MNTFNSIRLFSTQADTVCEYEKENLGGGVCSIIGVVVVVAVVTISLNLHAARNFLTSYST